MKFENFIADMGQKPKGKFISIERINNDGPYCPENCKWADAKEQASNRRNSVNVIYEGQKYTLSALGKKFKLSTNDIYQIKTGKPLANELILRKKP